MKRKISIVFVLLLVATITFTGCGSKETTGAAGKSDITFKKAINQKGTHVWYDVKSLSGKDSVIMRAIVITDGKASVYDPKDVMVWTDEPLGKLGDYASLSQEDAAALVAQKYKEAYKLHYGTLINNELKGAEARSADEEIQNIKDTYEELTSSEIQTKEPQAYELYMILDSTGNAAESEAFKTTVNYESNFSAKVDGTMQGHLIFSVEPPRSEEHFFVAEEGVEPFEVFDGFFGGYTAGAGNGDAPTYLLTKCSKDATFILDPAGTKGISIKE